MNIEMLYFTNISVFIKPDDFDLSLDIWYLYQLNHPLFFLDLFLSYLVKTPAWEPLRGSRIGTPMVVRMTIFILHGDRVFPTCAHRRLHVFTPLGDCSLNRCKLLSFFPIDEPFGLITMFEPTRYTIRALLPPSFLFWWTLQAAPETSCGWVQHSAAVITHTQSGCNFKNL